MTSAKLEKSLGLHSGAIPVKYEIRYKPAFSTIFITLAPGETITAEAGAMVSMDARLSMKTEFAGGLCSAMMRKLFGGESLFVNVFSNPTQQPLDLVLTQSVIGDIEALPLKGKAMCFQPGAYIAHTPGLKIGVRWAGFASFFAGEGLFKQQLTGQGLVFFGAYGGLTRKRISGDFIVDTGHLVAYDPAIKMNIKLAGGVLASLTSGEGLVNRLSGNGVVYLQSRTIESLVQTLRAKV